MEITLDNLRRGMELCRVPKHRWSAFEATLANHGDIIAEFMAEVRRVWKVYGGICQNPEGLDVITQSLVASCAYCLLADESREFYINRGYSEENWQETFPDLNGHAHDGKEGDYWLDTSNSFGWHISILTGDVIQLGRLQYQKMACPEDCPGLGLKKGETVANIHIPAIGPLDIDACKASLARASEYLPRFFGEFRAFHCCSWLLNPVYRKYLPPESNIIRFQGLGTLIPGNEPQNRDALNRVFRNYHEDPLTPTPRSRMQVAVQQILLNGESLSWGRMFIMRG